MLGFIPMAQVPIQGPHDYRYNEFDERSLNSGKLAWNPEKILRLSHLTHGTNCVGYAPSKLRQCLVGVAGHNAAYGSSLLSEIRRDGSNSPLLPARLEQLAGRLLCQRWHQNQAMEVARIWYLTLKQSQKAPKDRDIYLMDEIRSYNRMLKLPCIEPFDPVTEAEHFQPLASRIPQVTMASTALQPPPIYYTPPPTYYTPPPPTYNTTPPVYYTPQSHDRNITNVTEVSHNHLSMNCDTWATSSGALPTWSTNESVSASNGRDLNNQLISLIPPLPKLEQTLMDKYAKELELVTESVSAQASCTKEIKQAQVPPPFVFKANSSSESVDQTKEGPALVPLNLKNQPRSSESGVQGLPKPLQGAATSDNAEATAMHGEDAKSTTVTPSSGLSGLPSIDDKPLSSTSLTSSASAGQASNLAVPVAAWPLHSDIIAKETPNIQAINESVQQPTPAEGDNTSTQAEDLGESKQEPLHQAVCRSNRTLHEQHGDGILLGSARSKSNDEEGDGLSSGDLETLHQAERVEVEGMETTNHEVANLQLTPQPSTSLSVLLHPSPLPAETIGRAIDTFVTSRQSIVSRTNAHFIGLRALGNPHGASSFRRLQTYFPSQTILSQRFHTMLNISDTNPRGHWLSSMSLGWREIGLAFFLFEFGYTWAQAVRRISSWQKTIHS